ncbi:Predicted pyrophosphatase or phosphodiesterase, AlkP superfamily [Raineyella antarctica]|uniref:Predicted pyrophosphatase or phosphodiesterase, AlkP superfamily n=1 Tax=Raineyella antarctica TaxID=1577474 RepID=A0A1G6GSE0_9ACTN|nr:alkaline phosphatase family protein [Raineyella antarctica]SDB84086.1 Predicted pyrophosphatase or phosphodiesterase, AlkP superfamily [Raineyella antarctica]
MAGLSYPAAGQLTVPRYGHGTLADLLPAIGSRLGLGGEDLVGLPPAQRWVVVLIDGLGALQLADHADHAPYLASLLRGEGEHAPFDGFTAAVPSTTATSLTTLGTGLAPGQHGIIGYSCRNPRSGQFLNMLTWEGEDDPTALQPHPTYWRRLSEAGTEVGIVAPARFDGSGLTSVSLAGGRFFPVHDERDEDQRIHLVSAAATAGDRSVVYAYERELDHTGHSQGVASAEWRRQLRRIDALTERLRDELPDDVRIIVTGDHGMIDIPTDERIVVEDVPVLQRGVEMVAGEGRLRQLYTEPGQAEAVAARWRNELGDRAVVLTREEAVHRGWYGPVADEVLPRYGDVTVAMLGTWALMTRGLPGEFGLVGMHGSLTAAEMYVPLVVD